MSLLPPLITREFELVTPTNEAAGTPPDSVHAGIQEIVAELRKESDRAAVVIGAAKLDFLLYQALQRFLLPSTGNTDELLDGDAPLSTFSAKIHLCFRLGLIDAELTRALHLTRKIRNIFAHEFHNSSLDSGAHRDRVRELAAPLRSFELFDQARDAYFGKDARGSGADLRTAIAFLIARLESLVIRCNSCGRGQMVTLIHPGWAKAKPLNQTPPALASSQSASIGAPVPAPRATPKKQDDAT